MQFLLEFSEFNLDDQSSLGVKLLCSMSQLIGGDGGDEVILSLGVLLTTFSAPQIGD